ncbi:MAG: hypothetical protein QOG77_3706, partial [Solirubrobacteraceae bacterium]|nr:hypothetical protein [Solirubrobacteraceae bacterium]
GVSAACAVDGRAYRRGGDFPFVRADEEESDRQGSRDRTAMRTQ